MTKQDYDMSLIKLQFTHLPIVTYKLKDSEKMYDMTMEEYNLINEDMIEKIKWVFIYN